MNSVQFKVNEFNHMHEVFHRLGEKFTLSELECSCRLTKACEYLGYIADAVAENLRFDGYIIEADQCYDPLESC